MQLEAEKPLPRDLTPGFFKVGRGGTFAFCLDPLGNVPPVRSRKSIRQLKGAFYRLNIDGHLDRNYQTNWTIEPTLCPAAFFHGTSFLDPSGNVAEPFGAIPRIPRAPIAIESEARIPLRATPMPRRLLR